MIRLHFDQVDLPSLPFYQIDQDMKAVYLWRGPDWQWTPHLHPVKRIILYRQDFTADAALGCWRALLNGAQTLAAEHGGVPLDMIVALTDASLVFCLGAALLVPSAPFSERGIHRPPPPWFVELVGDIPESVAPPVTAYEHL